MSSNQQRRLQRRPGSSVGRGLVTTACGVLGITVLVASPAPAAVPASTTSATSAPSTSPEHPVQLLLDQLVASGATGALALVDDGGRTWQHASGAARLDPRQDLRPHARFRIGSLTKTFVATAALQAVADGRLGLDDPVSRWLPDLVPGGWDITLRMLLNHTSGLYDYTSSPFFRQWVADTPKRPMTPHDLIALATAQPVTSPPGQAYSYSNTGYLVAGLMIEAATGRDVEDLVQDGILDPLQLADTSFPERAPNISRYHTRGYLPPSLTGDGYIDVTKLSPTLTWSAGAMISTAEDLERFHSALLGGQLLPPAMLEQMLTTVPVDTGWGYGLGIESQDRACGTVWGHGGSVPGYFTLLYSDSSGGRTALVMVPTRPDQTLLQLQQATLEAAICQMLGRTPPSPQDAVSMPTRIGEAG